MIRSPLHRGVGRLHTSSPRHYSVSFPEDEEEDGETAIFARYHEIAPEVRESEASQLREDGFNTTGDVSTGDAVEEERVLSNVEGGSLLPPGMQEISSDNILTDVTLDTSGLPNDPISKADLHRMWMDFKRLRMTFVVRCKYQICSILSGPLQDVWQNNIVIRGVIMRRMQCMNCRSR